MDGTALRALDVPALKRRAHRFGVNCRRVGIDKAGAIEFAQDAEDTAGVMHVLHMDVGDGGRDFAEDWDATRQTIDVRHGEVDFASCAAARRCKTVLVEPPMAMSSVIAFSQAEKFAMERGRTRSSSCS